MLKMTVKAINRLSARPKAKCFESRTTHSLDRQTVYEIRLIDLFVDSLQLSDFGFAMDFIENGRPAYHPADLLKLFI